MPAILQMWRYKEKKTFPHIQEVQYEDVETEIFNSPKRIRNYASCFWRGYQLIREQFLHQVQRWLEGSAFLAGQRPTMQKEIGYLMSFYVLKAGT